MFNNSNMNSDYYYYQNYPKKVILKNLNNSRHLNKTRNNIRENIEKNISDKNININQAKIANSYRLMTYNPYKQQNSNFNPYNMNTSNFNPYNMNISNFNPYNMNISNFNYNLFKSIPENIKNINNDGNANKKQIEYTNSYRFVPYNKPIINKTNSNLNTYMSNFNYDIFKNIKKNINNKPYEFINKKNPIREIDKLQNDEEIIENEEKYKDFEYYEDFCAAKRLKEKMANEEEHEKYFGNKTKDLKQVLIDYENYLRWITNYALEKEEPTLYNEFCINRNEIKYMLEKYSESNPKIKEIKKKFELIKYLGMYSDDKYENFPELIEENGKIIALFRQVLNLEMKYISFSLFIATHINCADLNDKLLELLLESDLENLKFRKDFKEMIKSFKENAKQKDTPDPLKLKYSKFAEDIENLIKHNF